MLKSRLKSLQSLINVGLACVILSSIGVAQATLQANRNRLLDTYATRVGYPNRCSVWAAMSTSQKGVFLTITDLLGKRSLVHNPSFRIFIQSSEPECDPVGTECTSNCNINPYGVPGPCYTFSGPDCLQFGACYRIEIPPYDMTQALDHITQIYAINGSTGGECGGDDANRMFFSADDVLINVARNQHLGLPEWDASYDWADAHAPFTNTSETITGSWLPIGGGARGQMHFWSWDWESVPLSRPGVVGVNDPHIVEIDIDYDTAHRSSPECYYGPTFTYGRTKYQNKWTNRWTLGNAEYWYNPCQ